MVAMATPLARKGYDGVIVQIINMRKDGKLNRRACGLAFFVFAMQLMNTIMKLVGCEGGGDAKQGASAAETSVKMAKRAVDQGIVVEIAEAMSSVVTDLFQMNAANAGIHHVQAATKVQNIYRGSKVRREIKHMEDAARFIQATMRFRRGTQTLSAQRRSQEGEYRPGLDWLTKQMACEVPSSERVARLSSIVSFGRRNKVGVSRHSCKTGSVDYLLPGASMRSLGGHSSTHDHVHGSVGIVSTHWASAPSLQRMATAARLQRALATLPEEYPPGVEEQVPKGTDTPVTTSKVDVHGVESVQARPLPRSNRLWLPSFGKASSVGTAAVGAAAVGITTITIATVTPRTPRDPRRLEGDDGESDDDANDDGRADDGGD